MYTILCIENGDYIYTLGGSPKWLPFSIEELNLSHNNRLPITFNNFQDALSYLNECKEVVKISSERIIMCYNTTLFEVVEYPKL